MHHELTLGNSKVNLMVNTNPCLEQLALSGVMYGGAVPYFYANLGFHVEGHGEGALPPRVPSLEATCVTCEYVSRNLSHWSEPLGMHEVPMMYRLLTWLVSSIRGRGFGLVLGPWG